MNYGFVIDNRRCIGCHACSTACKSENEVPLGVARTWVKTVEVGAYPDVHRRFQVTRCNHCANPPCVRICPTTAMYQRDDGIVEFDKESCIGCKSCMQACPYDAIYIDPDTHTAAKCHYCSHRVDIGLEPACAVVCPVHAIIAGDLDDPDSEISSVVASTQTTVRKPEQGTAPKVLYVDGNDIALHPTMFATPPTSMAATDVVAPHHATVAMATTAAHPPQLTRTARSGATIRRPGTQGLPADKPLRFGGGTRADHMVQLSYNQQHEVPWHWPVPAYLVTKAIGAGAFLFLALGVILGVFSFDRSAAVAGGAVGLVAILLTTALLVGDLERPKRFLYILVYPQWRSWLARGAFLLIGFSTVAGLWWAAESAQALGWLTVPHALRAAAAWVTLPLALGAAVYTAFLFAQAEGRDLWQSPQFPMHLVVQALTMGAAVFVALSPLMTLNPGLVIVARYTFATGLIVDLFVTVVGELAIPHASEVAARAAHEITRGRYRGLFWGGAVIIGHIAPLALLWPDVAGLSAVATVLAAIGLYCFEYAFVMAPQEVPNS